MSEWVANMTRNKQEENEPQQLQLRRRRLAQPPK